MCILTRRRVGVLLVVLAPMVFVALAVADVRLVTMSSRHFEATGETLSSLRLHWPIVIPCIMLIAGVVLALLPRREKVAL